MYFGGIPVTEEYTKGHTEFILRNGKLAPAVELSKPKDRRTRIRYAEYPDGSRMITKIENCLTRDVCEKVAPGYLDGTPHYYLAGEDIVLHDDREFRFRLNSKVGRNPWSGNAKMDYAYWPAIMRKAGERFTACKKAAAEKAKPKIIEVVI